jgi:HEAT repeat protein
MLAQAKNSPDINNYLTYIFSSSEVPPALSYSAEEYHIIRTVAAVTLKNNIRTGYKSIPESSLALIRSSVPLVLQDKNVQIRNYAGNVITEIVNRGGILAWPEILPHLIDLVSNTGGSVAQEAQEGAMAALTKICEDNKRLLDRDYQGQRPLNVLIPKLIEFTQSPLSKVRSLALTSINEFIPQKPQAILVNLDLLLAHLFQLANDSVPDVRRQVCRAFVLIIEIRADKIQPYIGGLVDYIIAQQQKTDEEDLACDAAEFWLSVGEHEELWQSLAPYLDKIIPVLLDSMVYSEDDIADLAGVGDDADEEDRVEDIKPTFARGKGARNIDVEAGEAGQNGDAYKKIPGGSDDGNDFDEGEIEESEDDDDFNPEDQWNLRKCSAAALDVFATDFRGPVFESILPYLMTNLRHEDWPHREAAVLALGAVAEGCIDVVTPHLPDLVPYLISLLNDPEPLVRQITCWTLGRYSAWGVSLTDPADRSRYFVPMMEGLLMKMLDRNKRVQEAGASAFAHLEEKAGAQLIPYCEPIIRQFVRCFDKYKDKNMFILYDCVQTLAEHVGPSLATPELINLLMPALIHRWRRVSDQSRELFPLLECLSYVATAFGTAFSPFAPDIFARCIKIIHQNLEDHVLAASNPLYDTPDRDFLVTSLDLLSAIIQVLDSAESASLVSTSSPNFFELLAFCMEDPTNDVRQSSYALLGDCAKFVAPQLGPFLPNIMPVLLKQLNLAEVMEEQIENGFSVTNNACWSLGEVAIRHGKSIAPYIDQLLQRLVDILSNKQVPTSVNENAGIALGRLGLENAEAMAPHLALYAALFLNSMDSVDYTEEKVSAFTGFTMIVCGNPQAMESVLVHFFESIAHYQHDFKYGTAYKVSLHTLFTHVGFPFPVLSVILRLDMRLTISIGPYDIQRPHPRF